MAKNVMSSFAKCFCCILLFAFSTVCSQKHLAFQIETILQPDKTGKETNNAFVLEQLLVVLSHQQKNSITVEMGQLYAEIGKYYYKTAANKEAILYLKKAIEIQKKYKKNSLEILNKTRNNLAWIYSYEGFEKKRYEVLQEILSDNGNDKYTFNAGIDSAVIEANTGDFYSGLSRLNLLLTKLNRVDIDKELQLRMVIVGIYGKMYENTFLSKKTSDLEIIKKHQKEIERQFENSNLPDTFLYAAYNNIANVYEAFDKDSEALELYQKVALFYAKEEALSEQVSALNNMGFLYAKQGKHKEATACYKKVLSQSVDNVQKATAYDNMGYFLQNSSAAEKLNYFQKAIQVLLDKTTSDFQIPTLQTIRDSNHEQEALIFLVDLAYHYVATYKESKRMEYLHFAKATLFRIDELVSLLRYESNSEQSKLFWIEKGVNTYLLAVEVCYLLNQPDDAFYFMEKNKAVLLQENIKNLQAKLAFEIPNELLEQEYKLHYEWMVLDKLFQQNTTDISLQKRLISKANEFKLFMDKMQHNYPKYVQLKKETETVSFENVKTLNQYSNTSFITYILNDNEGYGIFYSEHESHFFKINEVPLLQKRIQSLKDYQKQPILSLDAIRDYQKVAFDVFHTLFPFNNALEKVTNKSLIIVPDDSLLNFPFEALVVNAKYKLSESYLLQKTAISYLQSFSVFEKIKNKKNNPTKKLLFMAPSQFSDKSLAPLQISNEMTANLNVYKATTIYTENEASKNNFFNTSGTFEIIHLSTHAGVDSLSHTPWISFQNEKVTLYELYGIENQAELVLLDACKTNDGLLASGEGIINLSRAFFNNGSQSVVASLWNVNEKAGNEIIQNFYKQLELGQSKSKALQFAKIKYLKKHQSYETLPYYWASFTLTGSTKSIHLDKINSFIYIFSILTILLIGLLLWLKNKKLK